MTGKEEIDPIGEDLFSFIIRFVKKLPNESFLSKKPNKNTPFEDSLAIQVMSASNLYMYIKDNSSKGNVLVAGILLRSLLETAANIQFIVDNKDDSKMIKNFLETSHLTAKKLYNIDSADLSIGIKWTNVSMTERIKGLDQKRVNFLAAWHYFSSFAHSDAGYIGTYMHKHKEKLGSFILGLASIVFIEIGHALGNAGVLEKGFDKMFYEAAREYLDKNK